MFGGHKEGDGQTNDLFFIRPKHRSNSDSIIQKKNSYEYKSDVSELEIEIIELHPDGIPPVARIMHSAVHFNENYLGKRSI